MILKIKRVIDQDDPFKSAWELIDEVENIVIMPVDNDGFTHVHYTRNGESIALRIPDGGYLLNNRGQTVERIA